MDSGLQAMCFIRFKTSIAGIQIPESLLNPFSHSVHRLCEIASNELQFRIEHEMEWQHDFGVDAHIDATNVGKMFGVLVVQHRGEIGYLAGFSGKIGDRNLFPGFVPPVVDILGYESFYRKGEQELVAINREIALLETNDEYLALKQRISDEEIAMDEELAAMNKAMKTAKTQRDKQRAEASISGSTDDAEKIENELKKESIEWHYKYKTLHKLISQKRLENKSRLAVYEDTIEAMQTERKRKSAGLQNLIFDQYRFACYDGSVAGLHGIFKNAGQEIPPSGAGDCAGTKLLHYAFVNKMKPLAMAEFWWGQSPRSEIRKHKQFYPSCRSKCYPLFLKMLDGLPLDLSLSNCFGEMSGMFEVLFEDDDILVIDKPSGMLSVPGKVDAPSVYSICKERYRKSSGPLIVHRLDMSTSGIMVVAKNKESHKDLQMQFLSHRVKKQYVALLDGIVGEREGHIRLPLCVDPDDRPRQVVNYQYGKEAHTYWRLMEQRGNTARVMFFPQTGRTHQLRVHAAHPSGLNCPIRGDDLYGVAADRLYLHARSIEFVHPRSKQTVAFCKEPGF